MKTQLENAISLSTAKSKEMIGEVRTRLSGIASQIASRPHPATTPAPGKQKAGRATRGLAITGTAAAVFGGVGWIFTPLAWPKWVLLGGVALLAADLFTTKNNITSRNYPGDPAPQTAGLKSGERYAVLNDVTSLCNSLDAGWTAFVEKQRDMLTTLAGSSPLNEDDKTKIRYKLLQVYPLGISMSEWISKFETADTFDSMKKVLTEFASYAVGCIEEASKKQCAVYADAENVAGAS